MLSVFCSPGRYTQGRGATAALGREMTALGLEGPALLIAGKTVISRLADTWKSSLTEAGIHHEVFRFAGACSPAEIERVKAVARQCAARTIVGAGGGKVLDTARAVAADLGLPVVNCPTVASSDAPCSALSVIYTEEGVFQEYRFYRKNPDLVLVDTQVIAQAPPRLLTAGTRLGLEANTQPPMTFLAPGRHRVREREKRGLVAALVREPFHQQIKLVVQHRAQSPPADILVGRAIDGITHRHVVSRDGLGNGSRSAARSEKPPRDGPHRDFP